MKSRRIKPLRYNGRIMARLRWHRRVDRENALFAAAMREAMRRRAEAGFFDVWGALMPKNPPGGMGGVLTRLKFDAALDAVGAAHP